MKWQGIDELFKLKMSKIKINQKQYLYIMDHSKLSRGRHKFLFKWTGNLIDEIHNSSPANKRLKLQLAISPKNQTANKTKPNLIQPLVTSPTSNIKVTQNLTISTTKLPLQNLDITSYATKHITENAIHLRLPGLTILALHSLLNILALNFIDKYYEVLIFYFIILY